MLTLYPEDEYFLDELGRIRPAHDMGWTRDRWQDAPSFEQAMEEIANFAMSDAFPDKNPTIGSEELGDLQAKQYLDIADGFYLATAVDARFAVWRFIWQGTTFFTMRPDFVVLSLATGLSDFPSNAVESAVRNRLVQYHREVEALKYAVAKGEVEVNKFYSFEWWSNFWKTRGISLPILTDRKNSSVSSNEKPLGTNERYTLLTIIAALCDHSAIETNERGAAQQIAELTEKIGAPITDDTIRGILGKIPHALASRGR